MREPWGSAPLASPGRMPGSQRLGRDPECEAAPLLQRPVILRPVADLVARPGDLVAARLMDLVGHRSSGERGSGPIRPTVALPKPRVAILHQRLRDGLRPAFQAPHPRLPRCE